MTDLPRGTVTFLFTDVEGSTALLKALGRQRYAELLSEHGRILRQACEREGGQEIDTQGDAFFIAFSGAADAIKAAEAAQRAFADHGWPGAAAVLVRMGIHTGEPVHGEGRYVGLGVHKAARICAAGHGGQVLVSRITHDLIDDDELPAVTFEDLGQQRLKDIDRPEQIYQLVIEGMRASFPPLKTVEETPFAGRESELAQAAEAAVRTPRRHRRRGLLGAALMGVVAAAIAVPIFALGRDGPNGAAVSAPRVVPNSVAVINAVSGKVTADIPVGRTPGPIVFGNGAVWVGNFDDKTVSRIDPASRRVETLGIGVQAYGLAFGDGALWVANTGGGRGPSARPATVNRIDITTARIDRIRIAPRYWSGDEDPEGAPSLRGRDMALLAVKGSVWVGNRPHSELVRIDSSTKRISGRLTPFDAASVTAARDSIWVANYLDSTVSRVDPEANRVVATITVGESPCCIASGANALWVIAGRNVVWRINPSSNRAESTIAVGDHPIAIAAGPGAVWVANYGDRTVSRIDPETNRVETIRLSRRPVGIAAGGGAAWVTVN